MNKIEEIKPNLFVQKIGESDSYRVVHPLKKNIYGRFTWGNIHWKNLITGGSWSNFFTILFVVALLVYLAWGYAHDTRECRELLENPQKICGNSLNYNPDIATKGDDNVFSVPLPASDDG